MWGGNSHPNIKTLIPYLFCCFIFAACALPLRIPSRRPAVSVSQIPLRTPPLGRSLAIRHNSLHIVRPGRIRYFVFSVVFFFVVFLAAVLFAAAFAAGFTAFAATFSLPTFFAAFAVFGFAFLWVFPTFRASLPVCVRGSCRRCPARPRRSTPAKWLRAARTEDRRRTVRRSNRCRRSGCPPRIRRESPRPAAERRRRRCRNRR